jgi:hypothetical protein
MNCKIGDLAMIVRADNDQGCVGRIVRVLALRIAMGEMAWQVEPPVFWRDRTGSEFEVMWDDRDLRPLRSSDGAEARDRGVPQVA